MAFWGVKIKPRKPYPIPPEELEGRSLHITQATLGVLAETNEQPKRSVVKCRVNDGPAVFLCSLRPGVVESVPLNLWFDEPVTLFVMGETAVHLCGYFEEPDYLDDEEESDDEMDEDFIQDDEEEVEDSDEELPTLNPASSVKIEEIIDEDDDEKEKVTVQEKEKEKEDASEDEDGFAAKRKSPSESETPAKKQKTETQSSPGGPPGGPETSGKKKKKKKAAKQEAKQNGEGDQPTEEPSTTPGKGKSKGDKKRFANGLEVENLKMGKPDGKQAKAGKKVFIHYIGKLVKNGKIFDSTVGKKPFPFRLGVNEVIRGFDIGVAGMRVGDKRRVTVPPAMGYRDKAVGPIPPNSWLCFDIELVAVK